MEKAGLKTFVYSFVFSLFTVFGVNGVYLRIHSSARPEIKIPSKNITLFLKNASQTPESIHAAPAKKIVLSVLPEIKIPQKEIVDKIPLAVDDFLDQQPPSHAIASNQIPLQTSAKDMVGSSANEGEKVISNFEKVIKSPPPIDEKELLFNHTPIDHPIEQIEEPQLEEKEPAYTPENYLQVASNEPAPPENLLNLPEQAVSVTNSDNKYTNQKKEVILTAAAEQPKLLIPLEKDRGKINVAKNEVKTAADITENQVALNAQNIPIKSMVKADNAKGTITKEKDSQWQSMEEKYAKKEDDSPWVVAKGGKFPRNEMVLNDKAYKQDDEEIRRILATNNHSGADEKAHIKLASETVKNLLIPIPEEILQEKNITPQLVSSNKNKKAEDEMAAKEALREEERLEEADRQEKTAEDATTAQEKGGILNSITSIFSSKNKNTPQIGDSVDSGDEEQNSLLSAFTRKKSRSFSKILPTEIRLSFQPNRAEISGQTLKWIRAFAKKTTEEPTTGLEIRIDGTSSPLLQRRRLNLLQNILMNEGANHNKIKTVFTAREPNSFILRTIRINVDNMDTAQNRNRRADGRYMQW